MDAAAFRVVYQGPALGLVGKHGTIIATNGPYSVTVEFDNGTIMNANRQDLESE